MTTEQLLQVLATRVNSDKPPTMDWIKRQLAQAQIAADRAASRALTPEDEAKANLKAKAEQAQRQAQVQSAEQTILAKAAANSPDHITPENVLTEAPDEVLRVIDTLPML